MPIFNGASVNKPDATLGQHLLKVQQAIEKHGANAPCFCDIWDPDVFQHYWKQGVDSYMEAHKNGDLEFPEIASSVKQKMPPKEMQKVANRMTYEGSLKPYHDFMDYHDFFAQK